MRDNYYVQKVISDLKRLEEMKEKLNKEIKAKEDVLKCHMVENGLSELIGPAGERVSYVEVESKRFNTALFKKHFESIYNNYLKSSTSFRFKFTY